MQPISLLNQRIQNSFKEKSQLIQNNLEEAVIRVPIGVGVSVVGSGTLDTPVGGRGGKTWVDSNALGLSLALAQEVSRSSSVSVGVWVAISIGISIVGRGTLDTPVGGRGGKTGMNGNALGLSLSLVELMDAIGSSWGGNRLVAGTKRPVGIDVWAVDVGSSSNRWLSFTLSNQMSPIAIGWVSIGVAISIGWVAIGVGWVVVTIGNRGLWFSSSGGSKSKDGDLENGCWV